MGLLTNHISFYSTKDNYFESGNIYLTLGESCNLVSCHEMISFLYACKNKVILEDICDYDWNTSIDLAARDGKDIRMKQFCYINDDLPILIAILNSGFDKDLRIFSTFLKRGTTKSIFALMFHFYFSMFDFILLCICFFKTNSKVLIPICWMKMVEL